MSLDYGSFLLPPRAPMPLQSDLPSRVRLKWPVSSVVGRSRRSEGAVTTACSRAPFTRNRSLAGTRIPSRGGRPQHCATVDQVCRRRCKSQGERVSLSQTVAAPSIYSRRCFAYHERSRSAPHEGGSARENTLPASRYHCIHYLYINFMKT